MNIQTPQNVVIENDLAGSGMRALASILDLVFLGIYFLICLAIVSAVSIQSQNMESGQIAFWFLFMPLFLFYSPLCEMLFKGQTLGKLISGIRVVSMNGENVTSEQSAMRWVFRILDLWICFGSFAMIFCSASERGQRLGDVLGETLVIKVKSGNYSIRDILKINSTKNEKYKAIYPGVIKYTDEDMLWIKKVIKRRKVNPSKSNKKLILQAAEKIKGDLNLEDLPKNKVKFLEKVLEDYIVLTRS